MADHKVLLSFLFIVIFFSSHCLSSTIVINDDGPEVEDEHPFNYEVESKKGPAYWGLIKSEWNSCNTGKQQSPIDINTKWVMVSPALGKLRRNYKLAPAVLRNRGHDISVAWIGDAGSVVTNGTDYKLLQSHWHTPSEHTINGKRYDMELHMVHNSSYGQIAVISILYTIGWPDPFLQQFLEHVKTVETELELGYVHPNSIKLGSSKYFRYFGSLTAPPCSEGVLWTVLNKVRTVSMEQIQALRGAVNDGFEENARPVQPLNGRQVYMDISLW